MILPLNKYHPQNCKVRSWDDIEEHFDNSFGKQHADNLANLVRHIINTRLSERLFGTTSMNKLIIGISDPIEWNREALHIEFNIIKQEWHFFYNSLPYRESEFIRNYPREIGIEKFDYFIKIIGW